MTFLDTESQDEKQMMISGSENIRLRLSITRWWEYLLLLLLFCMRIDYGCRVGHQII